MRYPEKRYSVRFVVFGFLFCFMMGTLLGVIATRGKIVDMKREIEAISSGKVRTQVKFLPMPEVVQLKAETVVWIDPGWTAIGVWENRLVLTMAEPAWMRDPKK